MRLWSVSKVGVIVGAAAFSSAPSKGVLSSTAIHRVSKSSLAIGASYRVDHFSNPYDVHHYLQDFVTVTVGATNSGTAPASFSFHLPCEPEVKLYQDEMHSGSPVHFVGEGGVGHVEVTLGPGDSFHTDCGVFALSALAQSDGKPALPGIYYVVFDVDQSGTAPLRKRPDDPMIAVGSYSGDTASVSPFFQLTGTSRVIGSGIQLFLTIINNGAEGVLYKVPEQEDCEHRIALYQDEAHSGTPFRYVQNEVPFGTGPIHWAGRHMVPLSHFEAYTTKCGEEPLPMDHLKRGTQSITPGTYYVTYMAGHDEDPKGILLNLGRLVIPQH